MKSNQVHVYLSEPMLGHARAGQFNVMNVLKSAVTSQGWQLDWHKVGSTSHDAAAASDNYCLYFMERPNHTKALTMRRTYHYPFWHIESFAERWRWPVAKARFNAGDIDPQRTQAFAKRLRDRVFPQVEIRNKGFVLIPLQGQISAQRSFQTLSPLEMVRQIAATGRTSIATLHPNERYSSAERRALAQIMSDYPNLTLGENTQQLLPDCAFVATQNSAVAFDGYLLEKPAILFAQVDFHHIALNVAQIGMDAAFSEIDLHRPDFAAYLFWFLQDQAINATAKDAQNQILAALRRGGWPI